MHIRKSPWIAPIGLPLKSSQIKGYQGWLRTMMTRDSYQKWYGMAWHGQGRGMTRKGTEFDGKAKTQKDTELTSRIGKDTERHGKATRVAGQPPGWPATWVAGRPPGWRGGHLGGRQASHFHAQNNFNMKPV